MKRQARRTFWLSMGITLAAVIIIAGIVTVDFRGRQLSFGDDAPPLARTMLEDGSVMLEIKLLGVETEADITKLDKIWEMILDFSCIPHR